MKLKAITIFQSLLIILLLTVVTVLLVRGIRKETRAKEPEVLDAALPIEETAEETETDLYETTGKKILLKEGSFGEIWIPVLAGVPVCERDPAQFASRNGMIYYLGEDETITSALGIDVSEHQGSIDWETVKAAGIDFVMLRAGFRGYESGRLAVDAYFDENMQGALAAGLDVGVYFYSQAISEEEAVEEAEMTLSLIGDSPVTYPVVYDWEMVSSGPARTDGLPVDTLTACTRAFCDTVAEAGFTPMIYQNKRTSLLKLDLPALADYDFWLAEYADEATYYYDYQIWQYCSDGHVPGVSGDVDLNVCFKQYGEAEE